MGGGIGKGLAGLLGFTHTTQRSQGWLTMKLYQAPCVCRMVLHIWEPGAASWMTARARAGRADTGGAAR